MRARVYVRLPIRSVSFAALMVFLPHTSSVRADAVEGRPPLSSQALQGLGKEIGPTATSLVYRGLHRNGVVIWIERERVFYGLRIDRSSTVIADAVWCDEPWCQKDANPREIKRRTGTESCKRPPVGGVAYNWTYLNWLGCQQEDCYFSGVSYQLFENGVVLGPLRTGRKHPEGIEYIIREEGKWRALAIGRSAPECDRDP